jgi:hypothetical protein
MVTNKLKYESTSVQSLRTEKERTRFLDLLFRSGSTTHILKLLGLKFQLCSRSVTWEHDDSKRFDEDMTKRAHQLLQERLNSRSVPTIVIDTAITQPAKDVSEVYGQILWGKGPRDHLHRPGEIDQYPNHLYWEDGSDKNL